MKPQEKYRNGLWVKIRRLPYLVAMTMEGAERSGLQGSVRERHSMMESLVEGGESYPDNAIIQAIVPGGEAHEALLEKAAQQHDEILDCLDYHDIEDNKGLQKHLFKVLEIVLGVLNAKEDQKTVAQYKEWLLYIAENVALAAKEGDFLGFGGERFSKKEKEFYSALEKILR